MVKNKVMVATSAGDWEGVQHRPHHFMKRAAEGGRTVLYVEPPVTLLGPLKNKVLLQNWKRWKSGLQKVNENLYVLSPPPIFPFGNKSRQVNRMNQRLIASSINNALQELDANETELYAFLPNSVDLLAHVHFDKVYYDCVDDHASFTGLINAELVNEMERELMHFSDVCFATAKQLLEDRKNWSSNFHLVPNGAEYEHFSRVQSEELLIPQDISHIKKPVIGFVGGISDWIDLDMIAKAAQNLPNHSFVMIGPVDTGIDQFRTLKNVHFLGAKSYKDLPNYIQSFDICLIPFRINKLTRSVNPIKMYEYLSAGKPIISTPLPEVIHFKNAIDITQNAEELEISIKSLLSTTSNANSAEKIRERQLIGQENSWDARWKKVSELIETI
ncbi:glycosyltransferase [Bacillus sp. 7894-2]|uniref:glycosyltransferase n=1 Tax=Bacillus sp. 7894-2 TaxID=2021695 RepID=UPI000BA68401|nr:glycosyltransferase [Bacillus sp. 7894-2]PAE25820.1 hypothetical protein CHI10_05935 [Bacillus sp. 7894-2]